VQKACALPDIITSLQNDTIKEDVMEGACGTSGGEEKRMQSFGGEIPQVKRSLCSPRLRWKGNIKVVIKEIIWDYVDWIDLAQHMI
jgi:hypothetical protein